MNSVAGDRERSLAALELVSLTSLRGVLFGIAFTLYCLCTQIWYKNFLNKPDRRKRTLFVFGYSTLIMIAALISFATDTHLVVLAFLDPNTTSLKAPLNHIQLPTNSPALAFLHGISPPVIVTLVCLMQIWRVWVVWTTSRYQILATLGSTLLFLASLSTCLVNGYYALIHSDSSAHPTAIMLGVSSVALLTSFNLLISLLVMGRLLLVRRRISQLIGDTPEREYYTNISSILVQSYSLLTVCFLADTIARAVGRVGSRAGILIWATESLVEVIAYFLIWYRVLHGWAWNAEVELQMSTLRYNNDEERSVNFGSDGTQQSLQSSTNNCIKTSSRVDP